MQALRAPSKTRHSRIVGILKLVLPLTALVLLSMVFMLARTIDPTRGISMASIDVEDRARDPRLSGARYAGVTAEGAALTITTQTARTDRNANLRLEVEGLELHLDGADDGAMIARAQHGTLDRESQRFEMHGGIEIAAAPGYSLTTDRIEGTLDTIRIDAPTRVSGTGPAGDIEANSLTLTAAQSEESDAQTGYRLVFSGGVRLLYTPEP